MVGAGLTTLGSMYASWFSKDANLRQAGAKMWAPAAAATTTLAPMTSVSLHKFFATRDENIRKTLDEQQQQNNLGKWEAILYRQAGLLVTDKPAPPAESSSAPSR
jgi:hypothetical protein